MKLKSAIKYQLYDSSIAILIYYCVVFLLYVASLIMINIVFVGGEGNVGGLDMAGLIFLFVVGLNSHRESSKMFLQNGVPRMTQFKAILVGIVVISVVMAVVDNVLGGIFSLFHPYRSMLLEIHKSGYPMIFNRFVMGFNTMIWHILIYILAMMTGLSITTLYARMNKGGKIAVSISVPVFFLIIVPILSAEYNIHVLHPIGQFLRWAFNNSPYLDALLLLAFSSVLAGISYLLMRRVVLD